MIDFVQRAIAVGSFAANSCSPTKAEMDHSGLPKTVGDLAFLQRAPKDGPVLVLSQRLLQKV